MILISISNLFSAVDIDIKSVRRLIYHAC